MDNSTGPLLFTCLCGLVPLLIGVVIGWWLHNIWRQYNPKLRATWKKDDV